MANKIITITIDEKDASIAVDLTGFHGVGCDALMKALTAGSEVTKTIHKPEFKATKSNTVVRTVGQ